MYSPDSGSEHQGYGRTSANWGQHRDLWVGTRPELFCASWTPQYGPLGPVPLETSTAKCVNVSCGNPTGEEVLA